MMKNKSIKITVKQTYSFAYIPVKSLGFNVNPKLNWAGKPFDLIRTASEEMRSAFYGNY